MGGGIDDSGTGPETIRPKEGPSPGGLLEPDVAYKPAIRLLYQDPSLDREILETWVGEPRRYRGLKPLLRGRNDNLLKIALTGLRNKGTIMQGFDV